MRPTAESRIEQLLDRQIEVAGELAAALEAERDALTGTSPVRVSEKAAQKVQLLTQFEQLENERRRLYTESGLITQGAEREADSEHPRSIAQRWRALMSLLAHCRSANETNGLIVSLKQGQVRQLLDILRGGAACTYGPQGQTFAAAVRPLARV
ncbi:MAG: flagellar protein FlgN [Proteobacteria bacterium]|nr:flagellar protein FlgN [Pseudomonadota bacterium]